MVTELPGIASREAFAVDLAEHIRVQLALRTVRHEALIEVTNSSLIIVSVSLQELQVFLRQSVFR